MKLNNNWKFRIVPHNKEQNYPNNFNNKLWYDAQVPGTIHTDLLENRIIDDPFYSDNELKTNWIHDSDWEYELQFDYDSKDETKSYTLKFEGLDTIAEISLNGELIGETENMFCEYKFDVSKSLRKNNILNILFHSPIKYSKQLEEENGKLPVALDTYRVYIRKAQYSFGWDWGPSFPTVGIWKNIHLIEEPSHKIEDVKFETKEIIDDHAKLILDFDLIGNLDDVGKIGVSLLHKDSHQKEYISQITNTHQKLSIEVESPYLWYPNGMGDASLYSLSIELFDHDNNLISSFNKHVGIRTAELILQNGEGENTFFFKVNGKKIFAKGANWIPADTFLPRIKNNRYEKLLTFAKDANMNIVRVWGGGIYEDEEFYSICDRLGLLVWQDFMFACGAYPDYDEFIENVSEEVNQNVRRLRLHPSIIIWCGNNENEWIWTQNETEPIEKMPGLKIYHDVIPNLLRSLDNSRPYWPSSPFGNNKSPNAFDKGNTHQWSIWSMWQDYTEVKNDKSKFVAEFGFQGPANIETFKKYIPKENCHIQDQIFEFHNKQIEGPERLTRFLAGHLPLVNKFEDYIYLTQLNQGFALKTCIEHWRTNEVTNGSVIWQLNDCWPVTSWSLIDSELTPKLSYHMVKSIFSDINILFKKVENVTELIIQNNQTEIFTGKMIITFIELESSEIIEEISKELLLESGEMISHFVENTNLTVIATLYDNKNSIVNRNFYINSRWKHNKSIQPKISFDFSKIDDNEVIVQSDKLAMFLDLYHPGIVFSERGFILLPGEKKKVNISTDNEIKFKKNELKVKTLNQFLN